MTSLDHTLFISMHLLVYAIESCDPQNKRNLEYSFYKLGEGWKYIFYLNWKTSFEKRFYILNIQKSLCCFVEKYFYLPVFLYSFSYNIMYWDCCILQHTKYWYPWYGYFWVRYFLGQCQKYVFPKEWND